MNGLLSEAEKANKYIGMYSYMKREAFKKRVVTLDEFGNLLD